MSNAITVETRTLPVYLQRALKEAGYHRRDISVSGRETYSLASGGGNGYRAFAIAVNLETGDSKATYGSWGGANPFNPKNHVDLDTTERPVPTNGAIIQGHEGGGHPVSASVVVHPSTLVPMLPSPTQLSPAQQSCLNIHCTYKSAARREEMARAGIDATVIDELVAGGFLSRNAAGAVAVTTKGRNARGR